MTNLMPWLTQVVGLLMALMAVGTMLSGLARHDVPKMVGGTVGGVLATVVLSGGLEKARDLFVGDLSDYGQPSKPNGTGAPPSFPWSTVGHLLLAAAAGVAVGFGVRLAVRWYRRRRKAKRESEEQIAAVARRRTAIQADHDAVREEYGKLRTSLEWLDVLALDDVTVPQTASFLNAMYAADDAARGEDVDAYRDAVSQLRLRWKAALTHARKTGTSAFSPQERDAIGRARKLLARARDGSGSEHERYADLAKARKMLAGIVELPEEAVASLEAQHRLSLTKGGEHRS
ncbi:DUF2786 domain-containing protein [Streptomyces nanshensis]|uniref:Uncharacterized protein n=1 Tax=Streptomyces nanshensis TaxID=518642 RepID=A0A1E7KZ72_9ACTN|nr:DUF2786 domain-containing protein [Streptomyces nanshensis]OEV09214.1 hypothetical protein AN218_22320 [Streptomyces nanshensis]